MRFGKFIFIGVLLGLGLCSWLSLSGHREEAAQIFRDQMVRLGLAGAPASPTPSPDPTAILTPSPSSSPAIAGQAVIKLSLYEAAVTVADPITDLAYGEVKDGNNTWIGFTTQALLAKYPDCKPGALGLLIRKPAPATPTPTPSPSPTRIPTPAKSPSNLPFKKIVNGYEYSYRAPTFTCVNDQAGRNAVAAAVAALKNQALPTLSATSTSSPVSTPSPMPN